MTTCSTRLHMVPLSDTPSHQVTPDDMLANLEEGINCIGTVSEVDTIDLRFMLKDDLATLKQLLHKP